MSDVEILGAANYRPTKIIDRLQQSLIEKRIRELSEQRREMKTQSLDLVYERDEKDWWWCEDV